MSFLRRFVVRSSDVIRNFPHIAAWLTSSRRWNWLLKRQTPTTQRRRAFRPMLETLEAREVPAVTALDDVFQPTYAQPYQSPISVLANDIGSPLTATLMTAPTRGTLNLNADGNYTYTQTELTVAGFDAFTYRASDGIDESIATVTIEIQSAATTTTLSVSSTSAYMSDTLTLTAVVAPTSPATGAPSPAGNIVFRDGQTVLATIALDAASTAVFETENLALGIHDLTATYEPTGGYAASSSSSTSVTIAPAPAWIEASQDDILVGDTVGFTAYPYDFDVTTIVGVEWDFNYTGLFTPDSATTGQQSVTSTFTENGTRTIAARVLTTAGDVQLGTYAATAHFAPPTLIVPDDMTVIAGITEPITVQATAVTTITSVEWWFSYNGEEWTQDPNIAGLSVQVPFPHYGDVEVWVKVTDANGESAEDGFQVTVEEYVPIDSDNRVTVYETIVEGSPAWFTVNDVMPDEWDTVTIYAKFGDGTDWELIEQMDWIDNQDGSISFQHVYRDNPLGGDVFTAEFWIENEGGEGTLYYVDVTVTNTAPIATFRAGQRIATDASSGEEVWAIHPGDVLEFIDISDAGAIDAEQLQYHFEITLEDGTTVQTINQDTPALALNDYTLSKVYKVKAWVEDKDGAKNIAVPKEVLVVVFDPAAEPGNEGPTGSGPAGMRIYGTLKHGGSAPTDYNRFASLVTIRKDDVTAADQDTAEKRTISFDLDPAALQLAAQLGANISYDYTILVYDVSRYYFANQTLETLFGTNHTLISEEHITNATGLILNSYGEDREIIVIATAKFDIIEYGLIKYFTTPYRVILNTVKSGTFVEDAEAMYRFVRDIANQLGSRGTELYNAIRADFTGFFSKVGSGFEQAATAYFGNLDVELKKGVYQYLMNSASGVDLSAFIGLDLTNGTNLKAFLLQFSGLTWERLSSTILSALGEGNVAAVEMIADWFANINTSDPLSMLTFLENLPTKLLAIDPNWNVDIGGLISGLIADSTNQIKSSLATAAPQLALMFTPGIGQLKAIYKGLSWLVNNAQHMGELLDGFIDAMLQPNSAAVRDRLQVTLTGATGIVISFAAAQFGLNKLPNQLKAALQYVPNKIHETLRAVVSKAATKLRTTNASNDKMFDGILTTKKEFIYEGKTYALWGAKDATGVKVKLAQKLGTNNYKFISDLKGSNFDSNIINTVSADYLAMWNKSKALSDAAGAGAQNKNPDAIFALKPKSVEVQTAEHNLAQDADACKLLNTGCFAAGTKLWTPDGFRKVEDILAGEFVFARDEYDPHGPIEPRRVEAKFVRTGRILHLHLKGGALIETTPEHPFYARRASHVACELSGWTEAGALLPGDMIRTDSGWVKVEEAFDTGLYETVYNLRVAEHHTYFVGEEDWGYAAWAHNTYIGSFGSLQGKEVRGFERHHIGQDAALSSLSAVPGMPKYSRSAAPAIILWGGNGIADSAHKAATNYQRNANRELLHSGATNMTINQQAQIARGALVAAKNAPEPGERGAITDADIDRAMAAFWTYISSLGASGNTLVKIPTK